MGTELSVTVGFSLYSLGSDHSTENIRCLAMDLCEPTYRFYRCVRVLRALPRNASTLLLVTYFLRAYLTSRSLTVGLHVTIVTLNLAV
jgi:hypothetical protein